MPSMGTETEGICTSHPHTPYLYLLLFDLLCHLLSRDLLFLGPIVSVPTYILRNCLIFSWCGTSTTLS